MRWAVVAILFIVAVFGFFIGYAVGSLLLTEFGDAILPYANSETTDLIVLLQTAFGVICALILTVIVIVFGFESLSEEPEFYWRP